MQHHSFFRNLLPLITKMYGCVARNYPQKYYVISAPKFSTISPRHYPRPSPLLTERSFRTYTATPPLLRTFFEKPVARDFKLRKNCYQEKPDFSA